MIRLQSKGVIRLAQNILGKNKHFSLNKDKIDKKLDDYNDYILQKDVKGFGLFRENEHDDIGVLVNNFTAPALARALRERESILQSAASLAQSNNLVELTSILTPFLKENVEKRRRKHHEIDFSKLNSTLTRKELVIIQRYINKLPRQVFKSVKSRASIVIPLCNVNGIASILFEKRSSKVRTHKQQVCFPGGMVDEVLDSTIVQTSLREMQEEIGIQPDKVEVLGILRCNWSEVASMTGIAVTPVIGFIIEDLENIKLSPNPEEVEQLFTIPLKDLMDDNNWILREYSTPVFTRSPEPIWGLTAYLLHQFIQNVLIKCSITF